MLSELHKIARGMLFLHGHFTRPQDWSRNADAGATPDKRPQKPQVTSDDTARTCRQDDGE
ncbi:MAG: hypothetical protein ABI178_11170 [Rhodanobacter sp.]